MTLPQKTFENLPEEKRERVLNEATIEFAEHGYHQASVNRIVNRLGIAKGSLFKYFGNKHGLFEYLFSNAVAQFKKPLKEIRDTPSGDFFERIEKTLLAGVDFVDNHPLIYRIYLKMLFQENFPLRESFLAEVRQTSAKYLHTLVAEAQASGQIRPDMAPDMIVYHLDSIMDRFLQSHAMPLPHDDATPITIKARAVSDFLRRGLGIPS